ncbi:MAG: transglutaminase family protein [Phycisphaerales bacterium]|nr:MAG: transglutaminase family protein [Phycisphaerales bacterium]
MFVSVRHTIDFRYDRPVFFEPMTVRLTPKQDATQRLLAHHLRVTPEPGGQTWAIEQDGTSARSLWFASTHDTLRIEAHSVVQALRDNPFDALLTHTPAATLPAGYPPELAEALQPVRTPPTDASVLAWAQEIAEASSRETLPFLSNLTAWIYANCHVTDREHGDPFTPERTLAERSGACRDVAILFIAACRAQGLAARFASGYSIHHPPESVRHELHAWAEVYLPGAGWRGYDPSLGLATADGHVTLVTAPNHHLAAPTTGSYRGTGAASTLSYHIEIQAAESEHGLSVATDTPKA